MTLETFGFIVGVAGTLLAALVAYLSSDDEKQNTSAQATTDDYVKLANAAIIAAYTKDGQEPPIDTNYLIYEATPEEITELIKVVVQARNEWYHVPEVVAPETKEEKKPRKGKNA